MGIIATASWMQYFLSHYILFHPSKQTRRESEKFEKKRQSIAAHIAVRYYWSGEWWAATKNASVKIIQGIRKKKKMNGKKSFSVDGVDLMEINVHSTVVVVQWTFIHGCVTASPHKPNADLMKKLDERECLSRCVGALDETRVRFYYYYFFFSPFVFTRCRSLVLIMQSSQCRVVIAIKMKSLFDWKQQQHSNARPGKWAERVLFFLFFSSQK